MWCVCAYFDGNFKGLNPMNIVCFKSKAIVSSITTWKVFVSFFFRSKFKEKPNPRNTIEMLLSKVFDNRLCFWGAFDFCSMLWWMDGWMDRSEHMYIWILVSKKTLDYVNTRCRETTLIFVCFFIWK